jgi:glyoxalase family protein
LSKKLSISTILTYTTSTFPYARKGVRRGVKGTGQVLVTAFSVPSGAMDFWRKRLEQADVVYWEETSFGLPSLRFEDPSGLELALVGDDADDRAPWTKGGVEGAFAIRGFHSVTLLVDAGEPNWLFLEEVFGFSLIAEEGPIRRYAVGIGKPGQLVDVHVASDRPRGYNGIGTIHHVAFRIGDREEQAAMRAQLSRLGFRVTEIVDRQYFTSIYFRMPGHVLFEIATNPPGFFIDEPIEHLGEDLKLPPWEEPNRPEIEAALGKIEV